MAAAHKTPGCNKAEYRLYYIPDKCSDDKQTRQFKKSASFRKFFFLFSIFFSLNIRKCLYQSFLDPFCQSVFKKFRRFLQLFRNLLDPTFLSFQFKNRNSRTETIRNKQA